MSEEQKTKREYNRKTKWYAVRVIELESDSKSKLQEQLETRKDNLPIVIRGTKVNPEVSEKVVF